LALICFKVITFIDLNNRLHNFCVKTAQLLIFAHFEDERLSLAVESGWMNVFLIRSFNWGFDPGKVVRLLIS